MRLPDAFPARTFAGARPFRSSRHLLRHEVSRRVFLRGAAGAAGAMVGAGALRSLPAWAAVPGTGVPKPIPGGIVPVPDGPTFHFFFPGSGAEPSLITDFNGFVGVGVLQGGWSATGTPTGGVSSGVWEADMRFMKGLFVGTDGLRRQGTFAFT